MPGHHGRRRTFLELSAATAGAPALPDLFIGSTPAHAASASPPIDTVVFGDVSSESGHSFSAIRSVVVTGLLGQSARRLQPSDPVDVWGGNLSVRMTVDSANPTYVTVKLDGTEYNQAVHGRLQLFCEGEQVGYYFLGAVDPLDIAGPKPRARNRFVYHTLPLPTSLTNGKSSYTRGFGRRQRSQDTPGSRLVRDEGRPPRGSLRAVVRRTRCASRVSGHSRLGWRRGPRTPCPGRRRCQ